MKPAYGEYDPKHNDTRAPSGARKGVWIASLVVLMGAMGGCVAAMMLTAKAPGVQILGVQLDSSRQMAATTAAGISIPVVLVLGVENRNFYNAQVGAFEAAISSRDLDTPLGTASESSAGAVAGLSMAAVGLPWLLQVPAPLASNTSLRLLALIRSSCSGNLTARQPLGLTADIAFDYTVNGHVSRVRESISHDVVCPLNVDMNALSSFLMSDPTFRSMASSS